MSNPLPTVTDPATLAATLAQVASNIQQYITAYKNIATVAAATGNINVVVSNSSGQAQASAPVTDPALISQVNTGAQAALTALQQQYTEELDQLAAYCQLAVANNVVTPK